MCQMIALHLNENQNLMTCNDRINKVPISLNSVSSMVVMSISTAGAN